MKLDAVSWTTGDDGPYSASHTLNTKKSMKKIEVALNNDNRDRSPLILSVLARLLALALSLWDLLSVSDQNRNLWRQSILEHEGQLRVMANHNLTRQVAKSSL